MFPLGKVFLGHPLAFRGHWGRLSRSTSSQWLAARDADDANEILKSILLGGLSSSSLLLVLCLTVAIYIFTTGTLLFLLLYLFNFFLLVIAIRPLGRRSFFILFWSWLTLEELKSICQASLALLFRYPRGGVDRRNATKHISSSEQPKKPSRQPSSWLRKAPVKKMRKSRAKWKQKRKKQRETKETAKPAKQQPLSQGSSRRAPEKGGHPGSQVLGWGPNSFLVGSLGGYSCLACLEGLLEGKCCYFGCFVRLFGVFGCCWKISLVDFWKVKCRVCFKEMADGSWNMVS